MTHTLTLKTIEPVTHDTNHLVFDRPEGYSFVPGQATDFALDQDGWRDETRPFTFVSHPEAETLEFIIKSYPDHDGVTERIGKLEPGDKVLIDEPWGAIQDKGPGIFIAGGAGLTPFIPILRRRARENDAISACTLVFANKTEKDIILRDEWEAMDGLTTIWVLSEENKPDLYHGTVDGTLLDDVVHSYQTNFYVCGPPKMTENIVETLKERGVPDERVIQEE